MSTVLRVNHQSIAAEDVIPLLMRYQLLPDFMRELMTDQAIESIVCTTEEIAQLGQPNDTSAQPSIEHFQEQQRAIRLLKIEKFKQLKWGDQIDLYFLQRQDQLTKVIYSLIRAPDLELLNELYFRIESSEQSFAELARLYSQGTESQTDGLVGPVELGSYHPAFASLLLNSPVGELQPPTQLGNWYVLLRIEKRIPAQLDEALRQRLLNELFEKWQTNRLNRMLQQVRVMSDVVPV